MFAGTQKDKVCSYVSARVLIYNGIFLHKAGLQELPESVLDFDQDGVSLYNDSLQEKETEQIDNLDDSLCGDEDMKENDYVIPSKEDLTQVTTGSNSFTEQLVNGEKNCSLVDELFDDLPVVSQTASSSDSTASTLNESFDKKIAPLFTSAKKKKKWFRTPVQSIVDENKCKQVDRGISVQSSDTKVEKAKPVFRSATKPAIGKKRKLSETSKDGDEKVSEPPVKELKSDKKHNQPTNSNEKTSLNSEEGMVVSSKKVSSTVSQQAPSIAEKANKKKRQKKTIEGTEDDQPTNTDETKESEEGMVVDSVKKVFSTISSGKASKKKGQKKTIEGTEDDQPTDNDETKEASEEGMVVDSNCQEASSIVEKASKKKRQKKTIEGTDRIKKVNTCKQPDEGKTDDTKTEKAKPSFKPGTKKQKPPETSKGGKGNSEPPVKPDTSKQKSCQPDSTDIDAEAKEVNFNIKEGTDDSPNDSMKKASLTTSKEVSTAEKTNKKKRQKKATEDKEATNNGIKKSKKEVDASIKKAAQQQAKIDQSFKNLDREQRKAEKELHKISRELQKVRKQNGNKDKKTVETNQSSSSSSSEQLWVQCDRPDCLKWRRLKDCKNPSEIPEEWLCSMNPGECYIRINIKLW